MSHWLIEGIEVPWRAMTEGQCGVNLHSGRALTRVAREETTRRGSVDKEELSERKGMKPERRD